MISCACGQRSSANESVDETDTHSLQPTTTESVNRPVSKDSLRLDIGEMIIVGFRGQRLANNKHIRRDIVDYHVGGVILFEYDAPTGTHKRNVSSPKQLAALCSELQALTDETLLIGIDQEGGYVNRLRTDQGFPKFMSAKKSAEYGVDSIRRNAALTAAELKRVGVNLNFAPCVDVDINPSCPVIGKLERSFSNSPKVVSDAARIWIDEQRKAGVVSCLKHFPGHGSASGDTHIGLVDVTKSWQKSELEPYRTLIGEKKVDMIMTAHVINGNLDPDYPSSLSSKITTNLLRGTLGYDGVIITDQPQVADNVLPVGLIVAVTHGAEDP